MYTHPSTITSCHSYHAHLLPFPSPNAVTYRYYQDTCPLIPTSFSFTSLQIRFSSFTPDFLNSSGNGNTISWYIIVWKTLSLTKAAIIFRLLRPVSSTSQIHLLIVKHPTSFIVYNIFWKIKDLLMKYFFDIIEHTGYF